MPVGYVSDTVRLAHDAGGLTRLRLWNLKLSKSHLPSCPHKSDGFILYVYVAETLRSCENDKRHEKTNHYSWPILGHVLLHRTKMQTHTKTLFLGAENSIPNLEDDTALCTLDGLGILADRFFLRLAPIPRGILLRGLLLRLGLRR